jgi:hypothetical protein
MNEARAKAAPRVLTEQGFIPREEHCNRLWPVNHPDPSFPGNGLIKFNLWHPGNGSYTAALSIATPDDHRMISEFLLRRLG